MGFSEPNFAFLDNLRTTQKIFTNVLTAQMRSNCSPSLSRCRCVRGWYL